VKAQATAADRQAHAAEDQASAARQQMTVLEQQRIAGGVITDRQHEAAEKLYELFYYGAVRSLCHDQPRSVRRARSSQAGV
jgi:hypothetical protein